MKSDVLNFSRPEQLQATVPPEARGLERDEVRLLVSTPDPSLVFDADIETKWQSAIAALGIDPSMLAGQSGHA